MYTHRSGMLLSAGEKTCLRWICLLPFLRAVINPNDTSVVEVMGVRGLPWLFPDTLFGNSVVVDLLSGLVALMTPLIFVLPVAFAFYRRTRLPLLGLVLVLINSLWLVGFTYFEGAVWATVAHSIQYLMIVSYAHAQDSARSSTSPIRPGLHGAVFYLVSIVLGVPLFVGLPVVVQALGGWLGQPWSMVHCVTMTVVAINLHHFIVDGSIWRSKKETKNA